MEASTSVSKLSIHDAEEEVPVLIVGGAVVGLTLAALLARHGIQRCLVLEPDIIENVKPGASILSPRTTQIYKELGLYDTILEASPNVSAKGGVSSTFASLSGEQNGSLSTDTNEVPILPIVVLSVLLSSTDHMQSNFATRQIFITHQALIQVLRAKCTELGVELRYDTRITSFIQAPSGTTAKISSGSIKNTTTIFAKYVVGCDPIYLPNTSSLDIAMRGFVLQSRVFTIAFHMQDKDQFAQLRNARNAGVTYITNKNVHGFIQCDKDSERIFFVGKSTGGPQAWEMETATAEVRKEKAMQSLQAAIGSQDLTSEIDEITIEEIRSDITQQQRLGNIFLAGPAAHSTAPTWPRGIGENAGIHDVHNLAWKLALVLKGQSGEELLDTYEAERAPIQKRAVENAVAFYVRRIEPGLSQIVEEYLLNEIPAEHLDNGYKYKSSILPDTSDETFTEDPLNAIARPGSIAHHVLVSTIDGTAKDVPISTFFGDNSVLFIGPEGDDWIMSTKRLQRLNPNLPPLKIVQLKYDNASDFAKRYNVDDGGLVLVRPDGIVAEVVSARPWGPFLESVLASVIKKAFCLETLERGDSGLPPTIGAGLRGP